MTDWELAIIGTAIADPASMIEAEDLFPSDFTGNNQEVWSEIIRLNMAGALDPISAGAAINRAVSNGADYVRHVLSFKGPSMKEYVARVIDAATHKSVMKVAAEIHAQAQDEKVPARDLVDYAEKRIISLRRNRAEGQTIRDIMSVFVPRLNSLIDGSFKPAWVPKLLAVRNLINYAEDSDFIVIAARPGDGKCLGRGTKVVMFDGSLKTVEDIHIGDLLMGSNSLPRKVLSLTQGRELMYWVRQNRAMDYRVNGSHILALKRSKNEYNRVHGEMKTISVYDLLNGPKSYNNRWKGYKIGIELPERPVPLEPYFLGVWLGDGSRGKPDVTNPDPEIIAYLQGYAERTNNNLHTHKICHSITREKGYHIGQTIRGLLNAIGVLNNKHIPDIYLRNSRKIRLELLAGLIDTDGHQNHNGIEITMTNGELIGQIKWLADSLGFRTSLHAPRTVHCQTGATAIAHRVVIHGDFTDCPIRIPRKRPNIKTKRVDWTMTGIRIEKDKVDDYFGFTLDGDGLFLLEDMTVTHNSSFLRYEVLEDARQGNGCLVINLDNDPMDYARWFIASITGIDARKLKMGKLSQIEHEMVKKAANDIGALPIYFEIEKKADRIRALARKYVIEKDVKTIVLDYIQQTSNGIENRVQDITYTTSVLREINLSLRIPVLAASQLSRDIEKRSNDKSANSDPQLADLRESGAIEQDATIVMFPRCTWPKNPTDEQIRWFPENVNPSTNRVFDNPKAVPIRFHARKNRNGDIGISEMIKWVKSTGRYYTVQRPE